MTLYQMKLLIMVDECGSISAAAQRLGITQPTASYQLQLLEQEVGVALLMRRSRGMELTRAGRLVVSDARDIFRMVDAIPQRLAVIEHLVEGPISLGLSPVSAASTNHFPEIYRVFHQQFPRVQVSVIEQESAAMVESLRRGEIDLGIMSLPLLGSGMEIRYLWREELVVVGPPDMVFSAPIDLKELNDYSWVLFRSGFGLARTIVSLCQNAGFDPRRAAEVSTMAAVIGFVSAGLGVSIIPREVGSEQALVNRIAIINTRTPMYRTVALVTVAEKSPGPVARALANEIIRYSRTVPGTESSREAMERTYVSPIIQSRGIRKGGGAAL